MSRAALLIAAAAMLVNVGCCPTPSTTTPTPEESQTPTTTQPTQTLPPTTQPADGQPNFGELPEGFTFPADTTMSDGMAVLGLCHKADYPALRHREASRFWYWVSETYESGSDHAAILMRSASSANELMAEIRQRANSCLGEPAPGDPWPVRFELLEHDGRWDQAITVASEKVAAEGEEPMETDGTVTLIAQRGPAVVAKSYRMYAARPITGGDAGLDEDLVPDVEHQLDELAP